MSRTQGFRSGVLVIDDHDDTRQMLALFLASNGVPVVTARNGYEGFLVARVR